MNIEPSLLTIAYFTNRSKLLVEQIEEVVLEIVENAPPGPRLESELDAV